MELEKIRNQQELAQLLEAGDMKEFYRLANQVLRLRSSHPVVYRSRKAWKVRRRSPRKESW